MVLGGLALVVGVALLAARNEEQLTATWDHLLAPSSQRFRRTLDAQLKAEEDLETLRREREREAIQSGQVLGAAGIRAEEGEIPQERRRTLSIIRRMLSAR